MLCSRFPSTIDVRHTVSHPISVVRMGRIVRSRDGRASYATRRMRSKRGPQDERCWAADVLGDRFLTRLAVASAWRSFLGLLRCRQFLRGPAVIVPLFNTM